MPSNENSPDTKPCKQVPSGTKPSEQMSNDTKPSRSSEFSEGRSSAYITLDDGAELYYFQRGCEHEKKLLFVMFPANVGDLDSKAMMDGLSKHFHCIVIETRGNARSQHTPRKFVTTEEDMQQDAADLAEIMRKLGHQKYSLLGLSDGSATAVILAAQQKESVECLVTMGCNCYITDYDLKLYKSMMLPDSSVVLDENIVDAGRMLAYLETYGNAETVTALTTKYLKAYEGTYNIKSGDICKSEAKKVACPALGIYGDDDWTIDTCHREWFKENIPNSTIHIFPGAPHFVHLHDSVGFNKVVADFINSNTH